jgi:hypothetical protein
MRVVASGQREPLRSSGCHIEDELGVAHHLKLTVVDVEPGVSEFSKQDITITNGELPLQEANGQASVAAPA